MQPIMLNARAAHLLSTCSDDADSLQIQVHTRTDGGTTFDFGVQCDGSLEAGRLLAIICMADMAQVHISPARDIVCTESDVCVSSVHPLAACMASQYAGWQISCGDYFGMGSGPMRAAYGNEEIFDDIGFKENPDCVVGVIESSAIPDAETIQMLAEKCQIDAASVLLAVAPTASIAGTVQVVARSLETALHKMHEVGCDLVHVLEGSGIAPLAPVAADDLKGIGLTNDAVLYGGDVTIRLRLSDEQINELGPKIPSAASADFGRPFLETFKSYDYDFYKIDPLLFSPAKITLISDDSGNAFTFGEIRNDILQESFSSNET